MASVTLSAKSARQNGKSPISAAMCHIYALPDELILEILSFVALDIQIDEENPPYEVVLTLSAVSRRLRHILEFSPIIWANTISFMAPLPCVERFLELSGSHLSIHKADMPLFDCIHMRDGEAVEQQWELLFQSPTILRRCASLNLWVKGCSWNEVQKNLFYHGIDNTRMMCITFSKHRCSMMPTVEHASLFEHREEYPQLTSLQLYGGSFTINTSFFPNLHDLLIILSPNDSEIIPSANSTMTPSQWIYFLPQLPQLRNLRLMGAIKKDTDAGQMTPEQGASPLATLRHLESLQITDIQSVVGPFLQNLRIPQSCDINIRTWADAEMIHALGLGTRDGTQGIMQFLQSHFHGENGAAFGPTAHIYAEHDLDSKENGSLVVTNYNVNDAETKTRRRVTSKAHGSVQGRIPRFHLALQVYLSPSQDALRFDSPLFTHLHQSLAEEGLAVAFSQVESIHISLRDRIFVKSGVPVAFFATFTNASRLHLLNMDTLRSLREVQESQQAQEGLFPGLEVMGAHGIDFTTRSDEVANMTQEGWGDVVDPMLFLFEAENDAQGELREFLETRGTRSPGSMSQIQRVEVICGAGVDDLADMLAHTEGGSDIEVVQVDS